jgi:cation transport ATPase
LSQVRLQLQGIHCASCVWLIERLPLAIDGLASAELDMARGLVTLTWDDARVRLPAIARRLDRLGYRPHRHAQLMRGKKSGVIGMIKPTFLLSVFPGSEKMKGEAEEVEGHNPDYRRCSLDRFDNGLRRATAWGLSTTAGRSTIAVCRSPIAAR